MLRPPPSSTLFPYTTLFRSCCTSDPSRTWATSFKRMVAPLANLTGIMLKDVARSEEHTSELQSHSDLVCRLLLEKKKPTRISPATIRLVTYRGQSMRSPSDS